MKPTLAVVRLQRSPTNPDYLETTSVRCGLALKEVSKPVVIGLPINQNKKVVTMPRPGADALTDAEVDRFVRDGFLKIERAFPQGLAC